LVVALVAGRCRGLAGWTVVRALLALRTWHLLFYVVLLLWGPAAHFWFWSPSTAAWCNINMLMVGAEGLCRQLWNLALQQTHPLGGALRWETTSNIAHQGKSHGQSISPITIIHLCVESQGPCRHHWQWKCRFIHTKESRSPLKPPIQHCWYLHQSSKARSEFLLQHLMLCKRRERPPNQTGLYPFKYGLPASLLKNHMPI